MDTHQQAETVGGRLSSAVALRSHQIHAESPIIDECAKRIDRHAWIIKHDVVNDVYTIEADNLTAASGDRCIRDLPEHPRDGRCPR